MMQEHAMCRSLMHELQLLFWILLLWQGTAHIHSVYLQSKAAVHDISCLPPAAGLQQHHAMPHQLHWSMASAERQRMHR
jgi:hypothetical protein